MPENRNSQNTSNKHISISKKEFPLFVCCLIGVLVYLWIMKIEVRFKHIQSTAWKTLIVANQTTNHFATDQMRNIRKQPGYLVYEKFCKIPNVDPYDPNVMKHFEKRTFIPCAKDPVLTSVKYNEGTQHYELHFEADRLHGNDSSANWHCCYKNVIRGDTDDRYKLSKCIGFNGSVELDATQEYFLVNCVRFSDGKVYKNIHFTLPDKADVTERLKSFESNGTTVAPSILMIGIDSMSRANLIRNMPNTLQFLYGMDRMWFDMQGYNKIGDNTMPNLMAVLTGLNYTSYTNQCDGREIGSLDKCLFVWKLFEKYGYVTSYGEDDARLHFSTFNYLKKGFAKKPVDYYMRPLIWAAASELPQSKPKMQSTCIGPQHQSERILNYSKEFAKRFKGKPYFGLFWMNLFSHDGFDFSTEMDMQVLDYFNELEAIGVFEESIVIFFSDHGIRWGSGNNFYEERLPFLYIWLPKWFRRAHRDIADALDGNQNLLINPFDMHMTLKNVLHLTGRVQNDTEMGQAKDCRRCQSFFHNIPANRTCQSIEIEDHWCTCNPFEMIDTNLEIVKEAADFIIQYINNIISSHNSSEVRELCLSNVKLKLIESAYSVIALTETSKDFKELRIYFNTEAVGHPDDGKFLATVRINMSSGQFSLSGDISRLNEYAEDAFCTSVSSAKKFCFCDVSNTTKIS